MGAAEVLRARGGAAVGEERVAHVPAAQQRALYGVVREHQPLGQARAAREQRGDVDYALAGEAAAASEVHPHLTAGGVVRVHAARPGGDARKGALAARGKLDADARVYYAAARAHDAALAVDDGAVERVQHRTDELARRARQQARVRVEREYIPRAAERFGVAGEDGELARITGAELRERQKRAALALIAAPAPVPRRFAPGADEQVEPAAAPRVQVINGALGGVYGRRVAALVLVFGLRKVGENGKHEVFAALAARAGEFLEPARKLRPVLLPGEDGRDAADGFPLVRHSAAHVHPRRQTARQKAQQQRVEGVFGDLARGQEREHKARRAAGDGAQCGDGERDEQYAEGVERAGGRLFRALKEPPAHVRAHGVVGVGVGLGEHSPGELALAHSLALCHAREAAAVHGARALVHARVYAAALEREYRARLVALFRQRAEVCRRELSERGYRGRHDRDSRRAGVFLGQQFNKAGAQRGAEERELRERERAHALEALKIRRGALGRDLAVEVRGKRGRRLGYERVLAPGRHAPRRREVLRGQERFALDEVAVIREPLARVRRRMRSRERREEGADAPCRAASGKISGLKEPGSLALAERVELLRCIFPSIFTVFHGVFPL